MQMSHLADTDLISFMWRTNGSSLRSHSMARNRKHKMISFIPYRDEVSKNGCVHIDNKKLEAWLMESALKIIHPITTKKKVIVICSVSFRLGRKWPCPTL